MRCNEHSRREHRRRALRAHGLRTSVAAATALTVTAAYASAQNAGQQPSVERRPPTVACNPRARPPLSHQARCLARAGEAGDPAWLYLPRLALAPVRLLIRTASEVLLAGGRVEDEYRIRERAQDIFFSEDLVFGAYPVAFYATGFGLNVGAHLVHRDLFGQREGLHVRAGFGGIRKQIYDARVHTGRLWRRVRIAASVGYRIHDSFKFYGIGNGERVGADSIEPPLDALEEGPTVRTHYGQERVRAGASAQLVLRPDVVLQLEQLWRRVSSAVGSPSDSGTPYITDVYDPDSLAGFEADFTDVYTELAAVYDAHASRRPDVPFDLPSHGVRLEVWGAVQTAPTEPQLTSGRAGIDLQPVFDLYRGDRVLNLRLRAVTAIGPRDATPFFDLPSLGGAQFLRGYEHGRFRGLIALLASVEYRYPVQEGVAAYVFTDAGRVYASWQDVSLDSLRDARVGFGGGLQIYSLGGALFLLQLASSIDGGLFVDLRFNTTLDPGDRH